MLLDDLLKNKGYRLEQCHQILREQSKKVYTLSCFVGIYIVVSTSFNISLLQHGRRIETETVVLDFANLSIQRHYYWPAIDMLKAVSFIIKQYIILIDLSPRPRILINTVGWVLIV